jgi:hypothetical protein
MAQHTFSLRRSCLLLAAIATFLPDAARADAPPKIVELKVEPASLTLTGPRDGRRFVVRGKDAAGDWHDLTRSAVARVSGEAARLVDGFVEPVKDGKAEVVLTAGTLQIKLPITVSGQAAAPPISFVRDVMPILGKSGCNAGTCHGGQKGRNGFKLSLRGYDPAFDHEQIVEDLAGRRVDRKEPANSLVLLKPTQGVPHEGKFIFDEKSRYYRLLRQWIAEGCESDVDKTRRVERIEVLPQVPLLLGLRQEQQLIVLAHYGDGSSRDVSRDAVYSSSTDSIVGVDGAGLITAIRKGDAAILIRYEGQFAAVPVSALVPAPNFKWTKPPVHNYVDDLVWRKLERIKVLPSELCTDAEFLRRVYLDLLGIPPTPREVREFLADKRETQLKRRTMVDNLLERREYVDFWTMRLADLMQVNRKFLGEKGVWSFHQWLRRQILADRPWNELVYDLVTGVGGTIEAPNSAFFRIGRESTQAMENTTHLFLGVRFNCNKCHDHPFERWTYGDYYHLAAYYSQVGIRKRTRTEDEVVYERRDGGEERHPKTGAVVPPRFPFSHAGTPAQPTGTRRQQLAQWLTAKENPYFARSMANRLWSHLIGRGIIDPVDDIRAGNPPSNPELLDALTADFIAKKFSIKHMLRTVATSRVYQLSIVPNATNDDDQTNFSHARPRLLAAEQLLDTVRAATGTKNKFPNLPSGFRASQLPDPEAGRDTFLKEFGQPIRESVCDCERRNELNMGRALALVNGPLSGAVSAADGRIAALFNAKPTDQGIVEEVYLATLCRPPIAAETERCLKALAKAGNKQEFAQDLMSALMTTSAFLFNR